AEQHRHVIIQRIGADNLRLTVDSVQGDEKGTIVALSSTLENRSGAISLGSLEAAVAVAAQDRHRAETAGSDDVEMMVAGQDADRDLQADIGVIFGDGSLEGAVAVVEQDRHAVADAERALHHFTGNAQDRV